MDVMDRTTGGGVLTERSARWAHEVAWEGEAETYGAESNPTGNPIGGGEGYAEIFTGGDYTVRDYDALKDALGAATAGRVVFVPGDAGIDMGGRPALAIPEGVTLASTRGQDGLPGGRIYSDTLATPGFFATAGDCVRITGVRVQGPYPHRDRIDVDSRGIGSAHFGMEIDNCDISGFRSSATYFGVGASRAYVHHNHIHHNQQAGLGYGVSVGGAFVLIEGNLFDWCRHHIASSGLPGSGYEARYNICGAHANGHLFDMHGGRDRGDATDIAGDWMDIHHNTFVATDVRSMGIRGVSSQGAKIHHNWFHSSDPENAVRTSGNTEVYENAYGSEKILIQRWEVQYG